MKLSRFNLKIIPHTFSKFFSVSRMSQKRGAFIVFEGLDRCGKSTQSKQLLDYLNNKGVTAVAMRFPERSTPIGQKINAYLTNTAELNDKTLHELFCQNRWEFKDTIMDHLNSGKTIVADRYAFSGVAYTSAKGIDLEWCKQGDNGLPAPDKVFFLDMDPREAAKRGNYGEERYEKVEFQLKVQESFHKIIGKNWMHIDASQAIDKIQHDIQVEADRVIESVKDQPVQTLWN